MSSPASSVSSTPSFGIKSVPLHLALYVGTGHPHSVFMLVQCIRLSVLLHWATSPAPWKSSLIKPRWRTRGKARRKACCMLSQSVWAPIAAVLLYPENTFRLVIYPFWLFQVFFFPCSLFFKDLLSVGEGSVLCSSHAEPSTSSLLLCLLTSWGSLGQFPSTVPLLQEASLMKVVRSADLWVESQNFHVLPYLIQEF